jgi:hypothetical protein
MYQLLIYADDVNTTGGNIRIMKKNRKALLIVSENAEEAKYRSMS